MKKINLASKLILLKLWGLAEENGGHYKLNNNETYIPLSIEILEKDIISICHYGEQNGDLMRDPEMLFWKDKNGDYFPYYFCNDYIGHEEIIGEPIGRILKITNAKKQRYQVEFADIWLKNIKHQQFND